MGLFDENKRHPLGAAGEILQQRGINRLRFASSEELLGRGAALVDETGREERSGSEMLLIAQATRAIHTYETVIGACILGRGVQASMLNRSLYDDVLDIHWSAANPDVAPDRAEEHERFMALAEHKLETDHERSDRPLTAAEQGELAVLIEVYGGVPRAFTADWHRATFEECFDLVKARWSEYEDTEKQLRYIYDVMQRRNNLMLHPSPTGFRQTFFVDDEGHRTLNRLGPDSRWITALRDGAGGFYLVLRLLAEEFELDREPLAESFSRTTDLL
ncbi:MAG: hypothetical protein JST59_23635, partial [Actinobacteria bacterium]|nr:hypothetical protein [Actinomycetota bacterium]